MPLEQQHFLYFIICLDFAYSGYFCVVISIKHLLSDFFILYHI